jgi:two-component system nitrate/nitrite response regulator NarL
VVDRYRVAELVSAVRAGASGYFIRGITRDVCIKSLEWVMIGEADLPTTFQSDVLGHEEHRLDDHEPILATDQIVPQLTRREKLILRCLVEGDSNKSIAKKIDIAEATVKAHVQAIHRKLRVHNRTQAAIWEMKNGLNSPTSVDTALSDKIHRDPSLLLFVHPGNEFGAVVEQIKLLKKNSRTAERIAIVVDRYRAADLVSAVRAGASGYFVRGITRDVCIKSLEWVMMGEADLPPTFQPDVLGREEHRLDDHEPILATDQAAPQLSPREKLILRCLVEGDSNKSIAKKIDIAEATVKVHVKAILRKLRVHSRAQAAIWGMKNAYRVKPPFERCQSVRKAPEN